MPVRLPRPQAPDQTPVAAQPAAARAAPRMPGALAAALAVVAITPAIPPAQAPAPALAPLAERVVVPVPVVVARPAPVAPAPVPAAPAPAVIAHAPAPVITPKSLADREQAKSNQIDRILSALASLSPSVPAAERSGWVPELLTACTIYDSSLLDGLRHILSKALKREIPDTAALRHILQSNSLLLSTIKDPAGESLDDQLATFFFARRQDHYHIQELYLFEQALSDGDERLGSASRPDPRSIMATELETYKSLDKASREFFGRRIWELDGHNPHAGLGYGDRKIETDTRVLRSYKTRSLLQERIEALRDSLTPFALNAMETGPLDTAESLQATFFKTQVERFFECLKNNAPHDELVKAFKDLDPFLQGLLSEIVWLCDGGPNVAEYGRASIVKEPRILLGIQNHKNKNILEQLIEHYTIQKEALKELPQLKRLSDALVVGPERFKQVLRELLQAGSSVADKLAHKVWVQHAGTGADYGQRTLLASTDLPTLLESIGFSAILVEVERRATLNIRDRMKADFGIQRLVDILPDEVKDTAYRVAMISAELKGIASEGGLGEAVLGMAKANGYANTLVIAPKYDADTLPQGTVLTETKYKVIVPLLDEEGREVKDGSGRTIQKTHKVFRTVVDKGLTCYLIENDELFYVGKGNKIYNGASDAHVKARFAHFQRLAAELALQFYKEKIIQVVHVQDSQAALVPEIYAQKHNEAWKRGETPPVVFTFHNNLPGSQATYNYHATTASIGAIGLQRKDVNSFVQGMETSDIVTTVSPQFAEEARSMTFGEGVDPYVRKAHNQGKLLGILNGNTLGWNPKTDKTLKGWIKVGTTTPVDLSYGPEDSPDVIAKKKQSCKEELSKYVEKHGLGKLDPKKPLLFYIGRLDPTQKGIDKLSFVMQEALDNGAQMVVIGPKADRTPSGEYADEKTRNCMHNLYHVSNSAGRNGAIVIEDEKISGKFQWQMGHKKSDGTEVPGFGPLLRAAADLGVFPSLTEPCGLVQGETWLMGGRVLATDVGGFHDTIVTKEDKAAGKPGTVNGFKFARDMHWMGPDQYKNIARSLREAIASIKAKDATPEARIAYYAETRKIMAEARQSTWTRTPSKLLVATEILRHISTFAASEDLSDFYDYLDGVIASIPEAKRPAEWARIANATELNIEKLQYIYTYASDEIITNLQTQMELIVDGIRAANPTAIPQSTISMASWLSAAEQLRYAYALAILRADQRSRAHFDLRGLEITPMTSDVRLARA